MSPSKPLKRKGFETPSPDPETHDPRSARRRKTNDIIAQAQTGTGKTAAFGLPILERLRPQKGATQALILVPTRELALQVTEEILSFNAKRKLVISPIYGGASMTEQLRRLGKGIDVVVGTPGRILDHLRRGTLDIKALKYLILDEADEMLNMGFIEDVRRNLVQYERLPPHPAVFGDHARTDHPPVEKIHARRGNPARTGTRSHHRTDRPDLLRSARQRQFDALTRIIDVEPEFYGIVFCRTKIGGGRSGQQADRTRVCGRRTARRRFAGTTRKNPETIQEKAGQYTGSHRRGGARDRHQQPDPRDQLFAAAGH